MGVIKRPDSPTGYIIFEYNSHSASALIDSRKPKRKARTGTLTPRSSHGSSMWLGKRPDTRFARPSAGRVCRNHRNEATLAAAFKGSDSPLTQTEAPIDRGLLGIGRKRINSTQLPVGPDGCAG